MKNMINAIETLFEDRKSEILFLLRLTLGLIFLQAGWGKFQNFENTVAFFASIHIPFPEINAILASTAEFVGGILLIIGLFTRLASLPLAFVMIVALLTAHIGEIKSVSDLFSQTPWIYLLVLLAIAAFGAGKWSVDSLKK